MKTKCSIILLFVASLFFSVSLSARPVGAHQRQFINTLLPKIRRVNKAILANRMKLKAVYQTFAKTHHLAAEDKQFVEKMLKDYSLKPHSNLAETDFQQLLTRVDVVPASLALAQAANESAWGRSRFAKLANNYYGQWCYSPGCGIVPLARAKGAHHEVRRFRHVDDSIKSYIHNLNTHRAYLSFRQLRYKLHQSKRQLTGLLLSEGLSKYSARGYAYTKGIKNIIRAYALTRYDST